MNENIDAELNELMRKYKRVVDDEAEACKLLDIQIENLQETREQLALPYKEKLETLQSHIRLPMLDRAKSYECAFGKITYRKGAVRRSWDLDALDKICYAKPAIKDVIWMFRDEKIGDPVITIKIEAKT